MKYFSLSVTAITTEQVTDYLRHHPDYLERYIMEEIELEQLERWIIRRSQRVKKKHEQSSSRNVRKTSLSRWKFCVHADKRQMLLDLTQSLQLRPTKDHVLWELANCISSAVGADGFRLYIPERGDPESLSLYLDNGEPKFQKVGAGITVPEYVARTREAVRLHKKDVDARFPNGIPNAVRIFDYFYSEVMECV